MTYNITHTTHNKKFLMRVNLLIHFRICNLKVDEKITFKMFPYKPIDLREIVSWRQLIFCSFVIHCDHSLKYLSVLLLLLLRSKAMFFGPFQAAIHCHRILYSSLTLIYVNSLWFIPCPCPKVLYCCVSWENA